MTTFGQAAGGAVALVGLLAWLLVPTSDAALYFLLVPVGIALVVVSAVAESNHNHLTRAHRRQS